MVLANLAAWFLGSFAVYYVKVYLYIFVFAANVCLAVAIFFSHTLGNPRVKANDKYYVALSNIFRAITSYYFRQISWWRKFSTKSANDSRLDLYRWLTLYVLILNLSFDSCCTLVDNYALVGFEFLCICSCLPFDCVMLLHYAISMFCVNYLRFLSIFFSLRVFHSLKVYTN